MPSMMTIKIIGVMGIASYAIARIASKWDLVGYQRSAFYAVPVAMMPDMPRGYRVVELSREELAQHKIDANPKVQAQRFAQGATCLAAFNSKDALVGVIWLKKGHYEEDNLHVSYMLPDRCGWDTGLWIAPEYRMSRAFTALWAGAGAWLRERGAEWSLSQIADYNMKSMLAHRRMAPVPLGTFTVLRLGPIQLSSRGSPWLTRVRGRRAAIDLSPALTKLST